MHNVARVYTPADTAVQTRTPTPVYSMLGADLRAEPLVLFVPPIDKDRYYSLQFIDGYTYNFSYLGSQASGTEGGAYLLVGPGWTGKKPEGIREVIESATDFDMVIYRTQLFGPDDLNGVMKTQAGYKAQPLSEFLGSNPGGAPALDWPAPLSSQEQKTSLRFFDLLDFQLKFAPTLPAEKDLRASFASIGLTGDGTFRSETLSRENQEAFESGAPTPGQSSTPSRRTGSTPPR